VTSSDPQAGSASSSWAPRCPWAPRLAIGAAVGGHTGEQRLQFQRLFDTTSLGQLEPFVENRGVQYSAPMAQLGVRWDAMDVLRLGASLTWAGTLSADSASGPAASREYDLPLQAPPARARTWPRASSPPSRGAGAGGAPWATSPGLGSGTGAASGNDTWEVGGGLELDNPASRATRSFPVRLGGQYRQLPFTFGGSVPTEWFVGGGVGCAWGRRQIIRWSAQTCPCSVGSEPRRGTGDGRPHRERMAVLAVAFRLRELTRSAMAMPRNPRASFHARPTWRRTAAR
jgi:hypothetical protein